VTARDLFDWTSRETTRYFSGTAVYKIVVNIPREVLDAATRLEFDLVPCMACPRRSSTGKDSTHSSTVKVASTSRGQLNWYKRDRDPRLQHAAHKVIGYAKEGIKWKGHYYFVDLKYKPFKAEAMEPLQAGLIGPVKIRVFTGERPKDST